MSKQIFHKESFKHVRMNINLLLYVLWYYKSISFISSKANQEGRVCTTDYHIGDLSQWGTVKAHICSVSPDPTLFKWGISFGPEKTTNIFNDYFISVFEQYAKDSDSEQGYCSDKLKAFL